MATAKGLTLTLAGAVALGMGALAWNAPQSDSGGNSAPQIQSGNPAITTEPVSTAPLAEANLAGMQPNELIVLLPNGRQSSLQQSGNTPAAPVQRGPGGENFQTLQTSGNVMGLPREFELAVGVANLQKERVVAVHNAEREMVHLFIGDDSGRPAPPHRGVPLAFHLRPAESNPAVTILSFDQPLPDGVIRISVQATGQAVMAQISEDGTVDQEYFRNRASRLGSSGSSRAPR